MKKINFIRIFVLLSLVFNSTENFSQSYKDIISASETLTHLNDWCSANAAYSTAEMTLEQPPTQCLENPLRFAKWFKFKATTSSIEIKVKISGPEGTLHFPYITLRDETLNELSCIQYIDETEDLALNYSQLTEGKWYYFSVNNHNNSKYAGTFSLCVTDVESNDFVSGAERIWNTGNWCSGKAEYTTAKGTPDGKAPSCIPKGANFNKWFIFQAVTDNIEISAKSGGESGTCKFPIITLWDESLKELACNNQKADITEASLKYSGLKTGDLYYISVDHIYNEKYRGTFSLCTDDGSAREKIKGKNPSEETLITGKLYYKTGPLVSGKVLLLDEKNEVLTTIVTDAKGKFKFDNLTPGKTYSVKIEVDDPKLEADIFLIKGNGEILKKSVRDKNIFRFEDLPSGCNFIMLIDCSDTQIKIDKGKIGVIGRMLSKKNPVDAVVKQRVYLLNSPQKIIDSTFTDEAGKFQFINRPAGQDYLLKIAEPQEENYTEIVMLNDQGKAVMTATSKTMDSKGFFHFEKLPAIEPEPMKLQAASDERIDLSAVNGQIDENKIIVLKNIYFESGEYKILENSFEELNHLAKILAEKASLKIEISGHTDKSGNENANLQLSANRAKAVADYIIAKGINKTRITYKGLGSSKQIAANDSEENRQKNRRVEFRVVR